MVADLQAKTGAVLVPPYDHPDIILGQGTLALEFEQQVKELGAETRREDASREGYGWRSRMAKQPNGGYGDAEPATSEGLDAVIAPCGGGGLLSGVATALSGTGIAVFGAEPSFEGADDCRRGLASNPPKRIETVKSLTIADGVRTPVGKIPWSVISDKTKVRGVYSVSEEQIKKAVRLIMERMKVVVEPSGALPLAVALYDEEFRKLVERECGEEGCWNVGLVLSGGNTTMEALGKMFAEMDGEGKENGEGPGKAEREEGKVGMDGGRVAENIAG